VAAALARDGRFCISGSVGDAAAAVAAATRDQPDICLLDLDLPGDGMAAAWELRGRLPRSRIVILTMSDAEQDILAAVRAGVHGYLLKTIDLRSLPHALWDIYGGMFTMPRALVGCLVETIRDTCARHRSLVESPHGRMTSREWEVINLLADDLTTREVAERLSITPTAVRVHVAAAVRKMGLESRTAVIAALQGNGPSGSRTDGRLPDISDLPDELQPVNREGRAGRPSLLLADEEFSTRDALLARLRTRFEIVAVCDDGVSAARTAEKKHPDICLLDLQVSEASGIEAAFYIHTHLPETRIVVMTSDPEEGSLRDVLRTGADGYVDKHEPALVETLSAVASGQTSYPSELLHQLVPGSQPFRFTNGDPLAS
jgi:DNA-binding NarL/FixJ family response regulator